MKEHNKIIKGNCLEVMGKIPDETVSLILTDPPYGMNYRSNRRVATDKFDKIKNDDDIKELMQEYFKQCYRILKKDTAIYVFCSWHNIDFFKQEFEKHFNLKNIIVWNKNNHGTGDLKGSYAPKHELVLFGHKGRTLLRGKRIADVINCDKIPSKLLTHPTEKPQELLEIFIRQSSNEGDIVFDGFMGTGSCGIACNKLNRIFWGCELDEHYHEIAYNRINGYIY